MADNVTFQSSPATPASGTKVGTDKVTYSGDADVDIQLMRLVRVAGSEGARTVVDDYATRSDSFAATGNGTAVDAAVRPMKWFGLQVKAPSGTPTSWTIVLEGSIDGTNYSTIITHTNTVHADGTVAWQTAVATPCLYFRSRCSAISLGTAPSLTATIVGMP